MNDMKCQIESHKGKEINTICLDKNCKNKRLCCLLCIKNFHTMHADQLIEVEEMNAFIQQENQKQVQNDQSCTYGQKQVIQGLEKISMLIDNFQKIIIEQIEKIKHQNFQDFLKSNSNKQYGIQYWNQILECILEYVEVDDCFINLKTSMEGQLNETEDRYIKIIKQSEESLKSIITQINQTSIKIITKPCFSENQKHADIVLIDESTVKKTNRSCAMAFGSEGFDPKNQSYQFAFNIQEMNEHSRVGVGNDEVAKVNSFLSKDWAQLGHGHYVISPFSNLTFHNTDESFNFKQKGINFKAGDKILIKYDHINKVLEFKKSTDQKTVVKMTITDMTKKLYPCVYLYDNGDQVQLVEY